MIISFYRNFGLFLQIVLNSVAVLNDIAGW